MRCGQGIFRLMPQVCHLDFESMAMVNLSAFVIDIAYG